MNIVYDICLILVLVGALNWWLVALFKFDLVAAIFAGGSHFGNINGLSRVVYGLVGLAALYVAFEYLM